MPAQPDRASSSDSEPNGGEEQNAGNDKQVSKPIKSAMATVQLPRPKRPESPLAIKGEPGEEQENDTAHSHSKTD